MSNSHSSKYSSINGSRDSRDSPVDISRDDSGASRDSFETTLSSEHRDEDQAPLSPDRRSSPDIDVKDERKSGSPVVRMGSHNSAFKKIPKD